MQGDRQATFSVPALIWPITTLGICHSAGREPSGDYVVVGGGARDKPRPCALGVSTNRGDQSNKAGPASCRPACFLIAGLRPRR